MVEVMVGKELEEQLMEAGTKLLKLPESSDELLALLDQVEACLTRVEQSPSASMHEALSPSLKALVTTDLFRHVNADVRASVASCVSEITRITAPEAPYTDDQMKQIFQLIVGSFEMLHDIDSRSYQKRVSILETVAKVRSCVVMLDLECDSLILEMFQHFLTSARDEHPINVISSMETIMTLVLVESEEITPELLHPLLTTVEKDNQGVLSVGRKLAERVLENCRSKLQPCLLNAVKSMGMSPNDFSKVVASICQETSDTTENDDSVSGEHVGDERNLPEKMGSDKLQQVTEELKTETACPEEVDVVSEKSAKFMTSNGDAQNMKDDSLGGLDSPMKEESSQPAPEVAEVDPDNLDSKIAKPEIEIAKEEIKPDQPEKKKRGRKPKIPFEVQEVSRHSKVEADNKTAGHSKVEVDNKTAGHSKVEVDNKTSDLPSRRKSPIKGGEDSLSENQSVNKSILPSGPEKAAVAEGSSPTVSRDEPVKVERRGRPRGKKNSIKLGTDHCSPSVPKEALSSEQVESDVPPSAVSEVAPEGGNEIQEKTNRRSGKKGKSVKETEKSSGPSSDSEEKPLKKSAKKVEKSNNIEESSEKEQGDSTKKGRRRGIPEKELPRDSSNKKLASSPKSAEKSRSKNEKRLEETPKTTSKRKRTEGGEKASGKPSGEVLDEKLLGSKIKVWWPEDEKFYEGVVDSFDPIKKKHTVLYLDGDEEVLILKKEVWEFVDDDSVPDGEQATDRSSPDAASETPKKKKARTSSDSASKQAKTEASLKKGKETSTSKSKSGGKHDNKASEESPKAAGSSKNSVGKSKSNTPKTASKAKDDTPKTGTKAKVDTPKSATKSKVTPKTSSKSKDATPKTSSKSKDATPKASVKSKGDSSDGGTDSEDDGAKTKTKSKNLTPKAGSKTGANGTSAKGKSGASKVQESGGAGKGKSSESANKESETKSGKKRRRVNG